MKRSSTSMSPTSSRPIVTRSSSLTRWRRSHAAALESPETRKSGPRIAELQSGRAAIVPRRTPV
jgi:hypothetical protein